MHPVAIIQAYMGSTRLQGKVLMPLAGKPVLWHVVNRLRHAKCLDQVVVATTTEEQDDVIEQFCLEHGVPCFRGSEEDVLDRYYQAAKEYAADPIVRVTADCPVIDPTIVDEVVEGYFKGGYDVYGLSGEFPDGLDCEVFSFWVLEDTWKHATLPSEREHVSPYMIKYPEKYNIGRYEKFKGLGHHRWTLDEEVDYRLLTVMFDQLYEPGKFFLTQDILELLAREPDLIKINDGIIRNEGYLKSLAEDHEYLQKRRPSDGAGQVLYKRAKKVIPGGTQLLSKRPEMFLPEQWPSYYSKARGVEVTDLDGNVYVDMSTMGVGACVLGYADPDVDSAVKAAVDSGSMCTLNAPEEVELSELLCELHPWAQMVRYARTGGEAMSIAVRIARTHTRRDKVAFCGYHGWTDWYLAANLGEKAALDGHCLPGLDPTGVPRGLKGTALPFHYNRINQLKAIVDANRDSLAAVVMEPQRGEPPAPGFLEEVRDIATEIGAVLIFDEITTGFRMAAGGIHLLLDVNPDIAVFAKAMANGYPMAAVIGTEKVMQAAQLSFISSTNWTERIGFVAALATIRKYRRENVAQHLIEIGKLVKAGWQRAAEKTGIKLHTNGLPSLSHFNFDYEDELVLMTLFTQIMLEKGYLAWNQFKPSFAHQEHHVEEYLAAVIDTFAVLAEAVAQGDVASRLKGPPAQRGFYRLT
jgi:glutamate-1-semialdehyde 2,1-aminomutase